MTTRRDESVAVAELLKQFPGVYDVIWVEDDLVTFKCREELSLASIVLCLNSETEEEWEFGATADYDFTMGYWLIQREKIASPLSKKLRKELKVLPSRLQKKLYPPHALGNPDLSLVTIEQIVGELSQRDIPFVFCWKEEETDDLTYLSAMVEKEEMLRLLELIRYRVTK